MNLPFDIDVKYIRRISNNEYSSSCPSCGGVPHRDGEYPDRFRIWIHSRVTGGLLGWCRRCGYIWTPKGERLDTNRHYDWVEERKAYEEERKRQAERALELLRKEKIWLKYHDNLDAERRELYYNRMIDDYWIDYWILGYNPEKKVWDGETEYVTPAMTIPIFLPESESPVTIRSRLMNPKNPSDKYRPEFGHLPSALFYTDRDTKPKNKVLVVEGEFKAMTTYIALDDPSMYVVGTPGKTPNPDLLSYLDDCEVVYILLDPDAYVTQGKDKVTAVRRMIDVFMERSRIIQLPYKVDDMILNRQLSKASLKALLNGARRIRKD